jgi:hypothetical protein
MPAKKHDPSKRQKKALQKNLFTIPQLKRIILNGEVARSRRNKAREEAKHSSTADQKRSKQQKMREWIERQGFGRVTSYHVKDIIVKITTKRDALNEKADAAARNSDLDGALDIREYTRQLDDAIRFLDGYYISPFKKKKTEK